MPIVSARVSAALERAGDDTRLSQSPPPDEHPRSVHVALGDPQAPFEKLLSILDQHGLLDESGRLRREVHLVSIGDHFDYGGAALAADAKRSGRLLLSWLAAHPVDQVDLIVGNHDLARVGELSSLDDPTFSRCQDEASNIEPDDAEAEEAFLRRYPALPSSETARRDFNGFSVAQRELVTRLLREARLVCALALTPRLLLCHAGVTCLDLDAAGAAAEAQSDAIAIARFLNERVAASVAAWAGQGPLAIPELHTPGSAALGEGGGIFYHRPSHPERSSPAAFTGALRRRFDPRALPLGVVQVIGHIRDNKCRELLGPWAIGRAARDGELRHLLADREHVRYQAQLPASFADAAAMIFTDGGMNWASAESYDLLDLSTLAPYVR